LAISAKEVTEQERREMHKLALSIVLTSQGICFLHAGTEFLRSKKGIGNSFESADSINAIDWELKTTNKDIFDYVKALIKMRKSHPAFHMKTAEQIATNILFANNVPDNVVAYSITGAAVNDSWKKIFVVYNGSGAAQSVDLPAGQWNLFSEKDKMTGENLVGKITIRPWSCSIYYGL
jgi:pullulanase